MDKITTTRTEIGLDLGPSFGRRSFPYPDNLTRQDPSEMCSAFSLYPHRVNVGRKNSALLGGEMMHKGRNLGSQLTSQRSRIDLY